VLLASALLALAAAASVATGRTLDGDGEIAYADSEDLLVTDESGGAPRPLVAGPDLDTEPAYSPDGERLAFARGPADCLEQAPCGRLDLVVARSDGTGATLIAHSIATYSYASTPTPSWSPDGSRIAFACAEPDRPTRICVVHADGGRMRRLTGGPDRTPAWSPDGKWIVFTRTGARNASLMLVSPDGRRIRRLGPAWRGEPIRPSWSQRGLLATLSATDPQRVRLIRADGKVVARSAPLQPLVYAYWTKAEEAAFAWSPDARQLLVSVASSGIYRISDLRSGAVGRIAGGDGEFALDPSWRPVCDRSGTDVGNRIIGTPRGDLICGRDGNDTIIGGRGRDLLFGGPGADRIVARDEAFDVVGCGAGRDTVVADDDDLVGVDCERVLRAG
jgi:Tol biopolymer transport system component